MMKQQRKFKRGPVVLIAIILVLAMTLTSTLAWRSVSQQALNQAIGEASIAGGRLHDDFERMGDNFGEREWIANTTANKDVYIENFGSDNAQDIFVRVRMYEYMEIGPGARLHPGDPSFDARTAVSIIDGAIRTDRTTWTPRLPGSDLASDLFRSYWEWEQLTAEGEYRYKWYMPTFNQDSRSLESDVKGDAVDPQGADFASGEVTNTTFIGGSHAFSTDAGLHDFWAPDNNDGTPGIHTAPVKYWNRVAATHSIRPDTATQTARPTLQAQVVTMADWVNAFHRQPGSFWVLDVDGWAYWAAPLAPGTATGLLLDSITLLQDPHDEWYYGIFIDAQMATQTGWDHAFSDRTPEGDTLLSIITLR